MFLRQDTGRQRIFRVVVHNGDGRLQNNRASVHIGNDEVNGAAGNFYARFQSLALGVQAAEGRQQCRMDIDDFMFVAGNEIAAEKPHKPGQADDVGLIRRNLVEDKLFKLRLGAKLLAVCQDNRHTPFPGPVHDRRAGNIADQRLDFGINGADFHGVMQGDGIGAAARSKDDHALLSH